jgi:transcriptional regulator with XRE-family HTH domain
MAKAHPLIDQLARARQQSRQSRPRLAARIGCGTKSLWNWEAGRNSPSLDALTDWANALGLDIALTPTKKKGTP